MVPNQASRFALEPKQMQTKPHLIIGLEHFQTCTNLNRMVQPIILNLGCSQLPKADVSFSKHAPCDCNSPVCPQCMTACT